jgi:hypothetical protein
VHDFDKKSSKPYIYKHCELIAAIGIGLAVGTLIGLTFSVALLY